MPPLHITINSVDITNYWGTFIAMWPGPIKGAFAQPAGGAVHGLNTPCHNSNLK